MATGNFDIAKAGWLYRQSSVLHRWKRNWFVLDQEGDLRYFESPDHLRAEERIVVRAVILEIKASYDCRKADPPEGMSSSKASFLELRMRDRESMLLCAESMDDMKAWQIALEEARTMYSSHGGGVTAASTTTTIISPPGYVHYNTPYVGYGYPGQVISHGSVIQSPPSQVIHTASGNTTIVTAPAPGQNILYVDDGRRRYYRGGVYPAPVFFW